MRRLERARSGLRAGVLFATAWISVHAPALATACSVCTAGRDEENQAAFLATTVFMSVLPLAVIGTILFVLRRRYKKLQAELSDRRNLAAAAAASGAMQGATVVER